MAADDKTDSRGFAGLDSLVSDAKIPAISPSRVEGTTHPGEVAGPAPEPGTTSQPKPTPQKSTAGRIPRWVIGVGALIAIRVVWLILASDEQVPPTPPPYSSELASASRATSATGASPSTVPPPDSGLPARTSEDIVQETVPAPGSDQILSAPEITYCLAQDKRMTMVQSIIDNHQSADVQHYNALVTDYNSRCSAFRYHQSDMDTARSYISSHQIALELQARDWLNKWHRKSKQTPASGDNEPTDQPNDAPDTSP